MSVIDFQFSSDDSDQSPDDAGTSVWEQNYQGSKHVLVGYVQPDGTLTLNDAVSRTAQFWHFETDSAPVAVFTATIAVAEQIPCGHPSHKKLAEYILAFVEENKQRVTEAQRATYGKGNIMWSVFCWKLREGIHVPEIPDEGDENGECATYMNLCAFVANLDFPESDTTQFYHFLATIALEEADLKSCRELKEENIFGTEVRDARLIGAAQYILVRAQTIYYEATENHKREHELELEEARLEKTTSCFSRLVRIKRRHKSKQDLRMEQNRRHGPLDRFTLEKWQTWKEMFHTAALDETLGEKCRGIAQRAVDLMTLQEKGPRQLVQQDHRLKNDFAQDDEKDELK